MAARETSPLIHMKRQLSQQEIDAVFQGLGDSPAEIKSTVVPFDFSRLDRIPKSQIRAVHLLHDEFCRNSAASLSAYLRAYITMNLVSLEQISYAEFLEAFESPTFIAYVDLRPYDGTAVMEISRGLVFTFVEMLLGGSGKTGLIPQRKVTEIEKQLMQTLLRLVLRDLSDAWKNVTEMKFGIQSLADEPQGLHVLSPAEAVVALAIETRVGPATGMINLAIPSIFIKRLRHMFERLLRVNGTELKLKDQSQMAGILADVPLSLEACLDELTLSARDLVNLQVGHVLALDYPLTKPIAGYLNGRPMLLGEVTTAGPKLALRVTHGQTAIGAAG